MVFFFMESKLFQQKAAFLSFSKFFRQNWKVYFTFKKEVLLKNRLKHCESHGVSQEELAAALRFPRQTIGSLEHGRYNPSIILAFKLARYFNTTIEDIFIYEEDAT